MLTSVHDLGSSHYSAGGRGGGSPFFSLTLERAVLKKGLLGEVSFFDGVKGEGSEFFWTPQKGGPQLLGQTLFLV